MQNIAKDTQEYNKFVYLLNNTSLGRRKKMIKYDKSSMCFIFCTLMLVKINKIECFT